MWINATTRHQKQHHNLVMQQKGSLSEQLSFAASRVLEFLLLVFHRREEQTVLSSFAHYWLINWTTCFFYTTFMLSFASQTPEWKDVGLGSLGHNEEGGNVVIIWCVKVKKKYSCCQVVDGWALQSNLCSVGLHNESLLRHLLESWQWEWMKRLCMLLIRQCLLGCGGSFIKCKSDIISQNSVSQDCTGLHQACSVDSVCSAQQLRLEC